MHPAAESTLKPVADVMPGLTMDTLSKAVAQHDLVEVKIGDDEKYVTASAVPGTDWIMGTVTDKSVMLAPLHSMLTVLLISGIGMGVVAVILAAFALTSLLGGLVRLRDALTEISSGHGDLTRTIPVTHRDEIGLTAEASTSL